MQSAWKARHPLTGVAPSIIAHVGSRRRCRAVFLGLAQETESENLTQCEAVRKRACDLQGHFRRHGSANPEPRNERIKQRFSYSFPVRIAGGIWNCCRSEEHTSELQ